MSHKQTAQPSPDSKNVVLGLTAIFLVAGTMSYFIQALNMARPKIAAALNGMELFSWSVSIPGLVSAFTSLIFGKLSDMYGRRIMLLIAVSFTLLGVVSTLFCTSFTLLIGAFAVANIGLGSSMPLCMTVVGDMFPPAERSKWIGLINIPMGIAALFGPTLGGWFADTMGWSSVFWSIIPLLILSLVFIPIGLPSHVPTGIKRKIDVRGSLLAIFASSTTIIGISIAGGVYPWASREVIGLLGISLIFWIFFFRAEHSAPEPILDPLLLRNRSFMTVAIAALLSCFAQMGMMMYFPMFLQGVLGISAARSGMIFTPFSVLMAFIGIPVGLFIARKKRYKALYVLGFAILTAQMFGTVFFASGIPVVWCVVAATVGGMGLGAIPTINTVIIQNAIPKRLLGAAMGAFFFSLMLGVAISPALLGSVMNATYAKSLALPDAGAPFGDREIMESVENPNALLSDAKLTELEAMFKRYGVSGGALFRQTVDAMRMSLAYGLRSVFIIGAITMLAALLLILTIREAPLGAKATLEEADAVPIEVEG